MDWISPASGLVGALIGGGASLYVTRLSHRAQMELKGVEIHAAQLDREDAARGRIAAVLGPRLAAMARLLREEGIEFDDGRENPDWPLLVMEAELAALEIPDRQLRELFTGSLFALQHSASSFQYLNRAPQVAIPPLLDHLVQCLFAWRRGDPQPEPSQAFEDATEAWGHWRDEHSAS